MIDEEMQLMKKPKADEIEQARETILAYLRQLNASGELQFEET
jgi:flagellar motor switch protein FliG